MLRVSRLCRVSQYNFGQTPLTCAFGKTIPSATVPNHPGKLESTVLPNGVKVVSQDFEGAQSVVGFYADAGAKYDPPSVPGLNYVMRFAIQTSNMDNALFQIDRTMRSAGFAYGHNEIRKRFLGWKAEGRRDMWNKPFEMLATGIVAPRFHEADIERFRDTMDNQLEELRWQNPCQYCVDQLETVAFFKEPLGSPRMVAANVNDRCSTTALLNHWSSHFHPNKITVAGINVPHQELIAAYQNVPYKHSAEAPHHAKCPPPKFSHSNEDAQFYQGKREFFYEDRSKAMGTNPDMDSEVIAAVGSIVYGADEDKKKFATSLVLKEIFQSKLDLLEPCTIEPFTAIRAFYRPYSSVGLLGYTIRGAPEAVSDLVKSAAACFPVHLNNDTIEIGRTRALMSFARDHLDSVSDYCDFIATSPVKAEEIMDSIQSVSIADVEEVIKRVTSMKPSVFVTGSTFSFPKVDSLNRP